MSFSCKQGLIVHINLFLHRMKPWWDPCSCLRTWCRTKWEDGEKDMEKSEDLAWALVCGCIASNTSSLLFLFLLFFSRCCLDAKVVRCLTCKASTTTMWRTCAKKKRRQTSSWEDETHSWCPLAKSYCPTSWTDLLFLACLCQTSSFSDTCQIGFWPYRPC